MPEEAEGFRHKEKLYEINMDVRSGGTAIRRMTDNLLNTKHVFISYYLYKTYQHAFICFLRRLSAC